ncbi:flavodoxin family protein [Actinokineospora sp. NBRC 105648]|uniref:flavodoxin family protein n=1 Tax=Actinokineospora sp. NBRC 105648 TaxID=3032206 RepID=UPI0025574527|nr:flavodoxin family protein [Actinokineospora sp. NBRC 105648]
MPRLLIVHHTPSPNLQSLFEAAVLGASDPEITGIEVVRQAALSTTAADVLAADAYLLGTPANLGYMSGALKMFFDLIYYPCLDSTRGRSYGLYVHGNNDTAGAIRSVESITTGLGWVKAANHVLSTGEPGKTTLDACRDLGGVLAAGLMRA